MSPEADKHEEISLIQRAADGDDAAFAALVKRHLPICFRIATRFGLPPADAEDLVQETFLAAYRVLPEFNFAYRFSTWIIRILLNRLSNYRRAVRRAKRIFQRSGDEPVLAASLRLPDRHNPQSDIENAELKVALEHAVRKLPAPQRTVFVLFELEGFKTREIAAMLDIPEGTVTSRLHHARRALRERLRHYRE